MTKFRFLRSARREIAEAHAWYENQRRGLGGEFRNRLEHQLQRIASNPLQFPMIVTGMRKASLRRFPHIVVFRLEGDAVEIIAVFHTSRDPAAWRNR